MFQLSFSKFQQYRDLLQERIGLYFADEKISDLERLLGQAMKDSQISSIDAYLNQLHNASTDAPLWKALISRLTVNETYFFRDANQFAALRDHVFPQLIAQRRKENFRVLRLWSAGCATGEESYSIAILLRELIPDINNWNIQILATDINHVSLANAMEGFYRERSFRSDTPAYVQEKYFKPVDKGWQISPQLRQMVRFAYLNLAESIYPSPTNFTSRLDFIICRNVTIYFNQETTREIAERFYEALLPDGWLVVGHSEPMSRIYTDFEPRNFSKAVLYQKGKQQKFTTLPSPSPKPSFELPPVEILPKTPPRQEAITEKSQDEVLDAQVCYEKAKALADQMQWDEALKWLDRALEQNSFFAEAYFMRGLVYLHQSEKLLAMQAFKRTLYLDRDFILAYFNIGLIHWQEKRFKEACRAWNSAYDLLQTLSTNETVPHGDDVTVGYLLSLINDYLKQCEKS